MLIYRRTGERASRAALSVQLLSHRPLTPTLKTPGVERHVSGQQKVLRALRGLDFKGKRVLDIGCRDGLYSFEAEKGGAREIIGIDNNLSRGAVELIIPWLGSKVRIVEMNLLALSPASFGGFDIVIFAGVLYHLQFPFQGLDVLSDVLLPGGLWYSRRESSWMRITMRCFTVRHPQTAPTMPHRSHSSI